MSEAANDIRKVTYAGMAVNVVIAVLKFVGGIAWNSQALIADAVHSASDMITDVAVIVGVKYWDAPADEEHPYGHWVSDTLCQFRPAFAARHRSAN